jgi:hypothetical protein
MALLHKKNTIVISKLQLPKAPGEPYGMLERTISALSLFFCGHVLLVVFRLRLLYQMLLVLIFSIDCRGLCGGCERRLVIETIKDTSPKGRPPQYLTNCQLNPLAQYRRTQGIEWI